MKAIILIGDALERLRGLPDEAVQCVVTSPPYWGLRDYGTAEWEGGSVGCDHRANGERRQIPHGDGRPVETDSYAQNRTLIAGAGANFKDVCGKCGAVRVDRQIGLEKTPSCGAHGLMRLRRDLTDEQRVYVVQRLLGVAAPGAPHGDKHGNE
jgi:hypothetical protein